MSIKTQTKVLRVLQDGEFERVGGSEILNTDVRIIAATNKDLQKMVTEGQFRGDLYFRLHVVPIQMPPLRERAEDIEALTNHFLTIFSHENNRPVLKISSKMMKKLISYNWPGNIRELKNLVERVVILADRNLKETDELPIDFKKPVFEAGSAFKEKKSLKDARDKMESDYIKYCLDFYDGNISKTAELLQVDRTYLYKKLKKMKINVD